MWFPRLTQAISLPFRSSQWSSLTPRNALLPTLTQNGTLIQSLAGRLSTTFGFAGIRFKSYKLKTHSGTKKRFKRNAKGQFIVGHASRSHKNSKLRAFRRKIARHPLTLSAAYNGHMKKLMPYGQN
ncbi:hypothetical protein IWQ62_001179 [Dispira parvispora]|uniref:50S ribosomal protein L35 n=1 Tax=Dispira parvispora TaxID=1520584 RepID=A0A9W8E586_9FUNG|nr:hypothetical protein IWQ62_001179 [Dispira parvispora]